MPEKKFALTLVANYLANFYGLLFLVSIWTSAIAESQSEKSVIAYVSSSTNNQEIHLINPDSTQDRTLWTIPWEVHSSSRIGTLSWHPDGTELAFDSGHNWQRSMYIRDLYAILTDGTGFRKVTRPPGAEGSNSFPTGTVKFRVRASEQGDVQTYIEGAKEPFEYFAKLSEDYRITQTVADWGEGIRQYIRLWDIDTLDKPCWFSEEGWVDVVPGGEVDLGDVPFTVDQPCPRLYGPSWSQDGNRILYLGRNFYDFSFPNTDIFQVRSHGSPGNNTSRVRRSNTTSIASNQVFRAVFAPIAARKNEILYLHHHEINDFIYHLATDNEAPPNYINRGSCPAITCSILDIAWLSDGTGFIFSQREMVRSGRNGVLYRYTFADKTFRSFARLAGENIGKFAISPDGQSIVFERIKGQGYHINPDGRGPAVQCPCALWIMNSDGSGMRQLVADGRAPAWGKIPDGVSVESYRSKVQKIYIAYYGRPADNTGLDYWVEQLDRTGGNLTAIIEAFGTSGEFTDRFSGKAPADLVNNIYQFLFGRLADSVGLQYYVDAYNAGSFTLPTIALNILDGAQDEDATIMANKLVAAEYFTKALKSSDAKYSADQVGTAKSVLDVVDETDSSVSASKARTDADVALFPKNTE